VTTMLCTCQELYTRNQEVHARARIVKCMHALRSIILLHILYIVCCHMHLGRATQSTPMEATKGRGLHNAPSDKNTPASRSPL
jgi:hypothetical protein